MVQEQISAGLSPNKIEIMLKAPTYGRKDIGSLSLGILEPARYLGKHANTANGELPVECKGLSVLGFYACKLQQFGIPEDEYAAVRAYTRAARLPNESKLHNSGAYIPESQLFVAFTFSEGLVDCDETGGPTELPFAAYSAIHGLSKAIEPDTLGVRCAASGTPPMPEDVIARYVVVAPNVTH